MEGNSNDQEFDDFFDTPGRSVHDFEDKSTKDGQPKSSKASPSYSERNQERPGRHLNESYSYSSDFAAAESDSDSEANEKRRKPECRSRSSSSRSAGTYSSSDSYSSTDSRPRRSSQKKRTQSSSSRSRSRSTASDSSVREGKEKGKRRNSYSSVTSSSTDSESERGSQTPRPKEAARRTAWETEVKSSSNRQDRPKTAKGRSFADKPSREDASRKRGQKENNSPLDSDSDMTDVSPILSPRNGSVNGHSKNSGQPAVYQAMPLKDSGRHIHDGGDSQALDLNILMKAVSELEKEKRVKSNTRRVMFEPLRARPMDRSNYTFSNSDTYRIEQENKRLLQQIMRQMHKGEERCTRPADIKVKQATLTASAVNRRREQKRIENENLALLRRLQKIKPSRGISRNEQLTAYNSTVLHGIPIATFHPIKKGSGSGRSSRASSMAGSLGRTRSLTSIHSAATTSSFGTATASRQSSRAGSRPTSAKKSGRVERPPWDDRW